VLIESDPYKYATIVMSIWYQSQIRNPPKQIAIQLLDARKNHSPDLDTIQSMDARKNCADWERYKSKSSSMCFAQNIFKMEHFHVVQFRDGTIALCNSSLRRYFYNGTFQGWYHYLLKYLRLDNGTITKYFQCSIMIQYPSKVPLIGTI